MARLKDDAQWIVLMGFIVSFSLFFLALVLNQSTVIGQTTAESVSEFPKDDIRGIRSLMIQDAYLDTTDANNIRYDIQTLAMSRQNAVVSFWNTSTSTSTETFTTGEILYNNGVLIYKEEWTARE